jgi:LDH2 family malate/lactate/ureidoglycolate dehydrogenase
VILVGWGRGQAVGEGLGRGAAKHAAALMRSAVTVAAEVGVENLLHLVDGLKSGAAAFDPRVLVEQRAVQALDAPQGATSVARRSAAGGPS